MLQDASLPHSFTTTKGSSLHHNMRGSSFVGVVLQTAGDRQARAGAAGPCFIGEEEPTRQSPRADNEGVSRFEIFFAKCFQKPCVYSQRLG